MKKFSILKPSVLCALVFILGSLPISAAKPGVQLQVLGTYASGIYNLGASEIVAYDAQTQRLFTVNGATSKIDVLSIANPSAPVLLFSIDLAAYGRQANSVDVHDGVIAAAVEANVKTDNGKVVFFDADGNYLNAVTVGALPDMLTFTPDGKKVLVANEGEPNNDYTIDPGRLGEHRRHQRRRCLSATVTTAGFAAFNNAALDSSIRIFGPGATVAQDLEPEYIAVSHNSKTAWVTLQENNAVGVLDLKTGAFTKLVGLGFKNHNLAGNESGRERPRRCRSTTASILNNGRFSECISPTRSPPSNTKTILF